MNRICQFFLFLSLIAIPSAYAATPYRNALILAYSPVTSIFEDDDIILEIYNGELWATNKTKKTIFINLSQCFMINNGSTYPMLETIADENTGSRGKRSTSIDEFLSISPSIGTVQTPTRICHMAGPLYREYRTTESSSKNFSEYDKRFLKLINELTQESLQADPKKKKYYGTATRHLTEDESISSIGASIAYAFSKTAEAWTNVVISTWVSDVIFSPYYIKLPKKLSKQEKKGFEIKENNGEEVYLKADSPFEFDEDKSPLILVDWEGNFKKGSFTLTSVLIKDPDNENDDIIKWYKIHPIFEGPMADWGEMYEVRSSFGAYINNLRRNREYKIRE